MKNTTIVFTTLGLALVGLTACSQASFQAQAPTSNSKSGGSVSKDQCVPDATDYNLDLNIYAFEMHNSTQGTIGFNANLGWFKGISLGFKVEGGSLDIAGNLTNPLKGTTIAPLMAEGKMDKSEFNFSIDTSIVNVGAGTASHTQLSKLTTRAIQNVLKSASDQITKQSSPWSSHVTKVLDDTHYMIPVGSLAGLRRGDTLKIWDYKYVWSDANNPCGSKLLTSYVVGSAPVATAVVWDLDSDTATLQLVGAATTPVKGGMQVVVGTLPPASRKETRSLKRSVRVIGLSQSSKLVVEGVGEIDLSNYLKLQTAPLMNSTNAFWPVSQ